MKIRHVESGARPGNPNDRHGEEEGRDQPAKGHFKTAEDDPDNVENKVHLVWCALSKASAISMAEVFTRTTLMGLPARRARKLVGL